MNTKKLLVVVAAAFIAAPALAGQIKKDQKAPELRDSAIKAGLADKTLIAQVPSAGEPAASDNKEKTAQFPILAQVYDQDNPPTPHAQAALELVAVGNESRVGILYTEPMCREPGPEDPPSDCPHIIFVLPKQLSVDSDGQTVRLDTTPIATYHNAKGWDRVFPACLFRKDHCPNAGFVLSSEFKLVSKWNSRVNDDGVNRTSSWVLKVGLDLANGAGK